MTKRKILYGYQIRGGALEIVPEEQRVVQMLFALYSAGASYQDISDALNRQGVPYSSEIPLWNKHKIKRMLENARYTGKDGYGTFGKAVAQLQPSVLQYTDQIRPLFLQIVYGFAQRRFWRSVGCFCPCQQSVHHGLGPFQTLRISFFGWQFC